MPSLLKVRLSLKGRPLRTYTFNKQSISIGRDPSADIFLDNTGISREHALIDLTATGYMIEDLGSANGTFVNETVVSRELLDNDDVVRIGKFSLWVGVEGERRDKLLAPGRMAPESFEGTTILSSEQMTDLTRKSQAEEAALARAKSEEESAWPMTRTSFAMAVIAALLLGIFAGAAGALRFLH